MAKLYRNATTDEYYTETAMDGAFVTLRIQPEGVEFLTEQGVEESTRIPAEMLAVLEENAWLSVADESDQLTPEHADAPVVNESETRAPAGNVHTSPDEPLPSVRLEPRPWMEQENVDRMRAETGPTSTDTEKSERKFSSTQPDRDNANPLTHPEDAAFMGNVWMWVLVAAVVVIVVWGLFEVL